MGRTLDSITKKILIFSIVFAVVSMILTFWFSLLLFPLEKVLDYSIYLPLRNEASLTLLSIFLRGTILPLLLMMMTLSYKEKFNSKELQNLLRSINILFVGFFFLTLLTLYENLGVFFSLRLNPERDLTFIQANLYFGNKIFGFFLQIIANIVFLFGLLWFLLILYKGTNR
jgi:hypothetical protein